MRKRSHYKTERAGVAGGKGTPRGDRQFVGALYRGLEILRCYRPVDGVLGNQELSQRSGLPKATVSRLTYTLSKLGYLIYLPDEGKYRMGVSVLGLGYACLGGLKMRETAQPHMQELADYAGDGALVALSGRDELSMIYIACARSVGVISLNLNVGSRISLGRSSAGRAYLAGLKDDEREPIMERLRIHFGKERWTPIRSGILRAVQEVRNQGFCLNAGEWHPQINAVAVPFRPSHPDMPVMAFNCGGPSYVLSTERLRKDFGPRLVALVNKVTFFDGTKAFSSRTASPDKRRKRS